MFPLLHVGFHLKLFCDFINIRNIDKYITASFFLSWHERQLDTNDISENITKRLIFPSYIRFSKNRRRVAKYIPPRQSATGPAARIRPPLSPTKKRTHNKNATSYSEYGRLSHVLSLTYLYFYDRRQLLWPGRQVRIL